MDQVQEELAHDTASPSASLVIFFLAHLWRLGFLYAHHYTLYWQTILPKVSGTSVSTPGSASEISPPPEIEFQFSGINGLTCLLCARQFKTLSQLRLHLSFSETAIYAQGDGLGASEGKERGKYKEGFSNYVHMVQDAVVLYIQVFL